MFKSNCGGGAGYLNSWPLQSAEENSSAFALIFYGDSTTTFGGMGFTFLEGVSACSLLVVVSKADVTAIFLPLKKF